MRAILQVADTGPLESLVLMLRSVGYQCYVPSERLKRTLRELGCDTVLDIAGLVAGMGYSPPLRLPEATEEDMQRNDVLYVDVKGHRNGPKVWSRWPHLQARTLWYRINGGAPEHVVNARGDHGNEVNPPCPVLTPNRWYGDGWIETTPKEKTEGWVTRSPAPWSYGFWPPFYRFNDYLAKYGRASPPPAGPVCFIHNLTGWGYGALLDAVKDCKIRFYGAGSPHGLVNHKEVAGILANAFCMVHLKSNDAPGYALYEALAAACPVIVSRRLIWRCRMQDLFIPGETCLVFDRETHDALSPEDVAACKAELEDNLRRLADPDFNRKLGLAGHQRLKEIMWSEANPKDVDSLRAFLQRCYG